MGRQDPVDVPRRRGPGGVGQPRVRLGVLQQVMQRHLTVQPVRRPLAASERGPRRLQVIIFGGRRREGVRFNGETCNGKGRWGREEGVKACGFNGETCNVRVQVPAPCSRSKATARLGAKSPEARRPDPTPIPRKNWACACVYWRRRTQWSMVAHTLHNTKVGHRYTPNAPVSLAA